MEDKDPIINKLKKYKNTSDYQLSEEEIDYLNKNYHKITTKRGEIAYIIENRYLFRKETIYKRDNSILFRCHKYRETEKCSCFIIFKNNKIINGNIKHNHEGSVKEIMKYKVKDDIKKKIDEIENPYNIKLKNCTKI